MNDEDNEPHIAHAEWVGIGDDVHLVLRTQAAAPWVKSSYLWRGITRRPVDVAGLQRLKEMLCTSSTSV